MPKFVIAIAAAVIAAVSLASGAAEAAVPAKDAALRATLEKLWVGHIDAVRKVDVAEIAGDKVATKTAENGVVANAHDIANAVAGFYGKPAGDQLFTLLAGHYAAVKAYLDATVAKDTAGQRKATSQLTSNANEIATFLSGANPYLPKATLSEMLMMHGSQHITQIQQLAAKQDAAEVKTQAEMKKHVIDIADAMADAIAKQFPNKV